MPSTYPSRTELNEELFADYMSKPDLQELVAKWLGGQVYERLAYVSRAPTAAGDRFAARY